MNPLGISVLFVICSVLLSFLKNIFFQSSTSTNSIIRFSKVFQLTNNKMQQNPKKYRSLFQAYHKSQIFDVQKFSNAFPNRQNFNQQVLTDSIKKEEKSFMCGADYLVLVLSGIVRGNDLVTQWQNIINIYKLPLMTKTHQLKLSSKLLIPNQCKTVYKNTQSEQQIYYKLMIIKKQQIIAMEINNDKVQLYKLKENYLKNQNSVTNYLEIQSIDFDDGWIAYCTKQKSWIVHIQYYMHLRHLSSYYKTQHYNQVQNNRRLNKKLLQNQSYHQQQYQQYEQQYQYMQLIDKTQIDLANFQTGQQQKSSQKNSMKKIRIRNILIKNQEKSEENKKGSKGLYISILYDYYDLALPYKQIIFSTFYTSQYNMNLLSKTVIDNYSYGYNLDQVKTQCVPYLNQQTLKSDVSCLIFKDNSLYVLFVNLVNVYEKPIPLSNTNYNINNYTTYDMNNINEKANDSQDNTHHHQQQEYQTQQQQQAFQEQSQTNQTLVSKQNSQLNWFIRQLDQFFNVDDITTDDSDLLWMMNLQQQQQSPVATQNYFQQDKIKQAQLKNYRFLLKVSSTQKLTLLKPSIPNPIIYYANNFGQYYLFSFYIPSQVSQKIDILQQTQVSSIVYNLESLSNQKQQDRLIKEIKWFDQEQLVIVIWGSAIQVFYYQCVSLEESSSQGIAMSVILPFIQLFATVFCLLRMIWSNQ